MKTSTKYILGAASGAAMGGATGAAIPIKDLEWQLRKRYPNDTEEQLKKRLKVERLKNAAVGALAGAGIMSTAVYLSNRPKSINKAPVGPKTGSIEAHLLDSKLRAQVASRHNTKLRAEYQNSKLRKDRLRETEFAARYDRARGRDLPGASREDVLVSFEEDYDKGKSKFNYGGLNSAKRRFIMNEGADKYDELRSQGKGALLKGLSKYRLYSN